MNRKLNEDGSAKKQDVELKGDLDMVLVDRFGQCGEGLEHFWGMPRLGSDWSAMRDWLKRRLEAHEMTDSHDF